MAVLTDLGLPKSWSARDVDIAQQLNDQQTFTDFVRAAEGVCEFLFDEQKKHYRENRDRAASEHKKHVFECVAMLMSVLWQSSPEPEDYLDDSLDE